MVKQSREGFTARKPGQMAVGITLGLVGAHVVPPVVAGIKLYISKNMEKHGGKIAQIFTRKSFSQKPTMMASIPSAKAQGPVTSTSTEVTQPSAAAMDGDKQEGGDVRTNEERPTHTADFQQSVLEGTPEGTPGVGNSATPSAPAAGEKA